MLIDILTLFPKMFKGPFAESIIKRAQEKKLVEIKIHNLRKWTKDKRQTVDDRPFGGGSGMILKVDILCEAIFGLAGEAAIELGNSKELEWSKKKHRIILMAPSGQKFNQKKAKELAKLDYLLLVCGHYEGVDERVREHLVDEEISIGDYVLTGGELPAMIVVDTLVRLIPGVLEKPEATKNESFSFSKPHALCPKLLEYPQYTRPANFRGWKVPKILLSGNHLQIQEWRKKQALRKTQVSRPDLLK